MKAVFGCHLQLVRSFRAETKRDGHYCVADEVVNIRNHDAEWMSHAGQVWLRAHHPA